MAQFGSRFHASRNERIASGLAKAYIIWKPWSKNACASLFDEDIGCVNVPRPVLKSSMGWVLRSNTVFGAGAWRPAPAHWMATSIEREAGPTERNAISHDPSSRADGITGASSNKIHCASACRSPSFSSSTLPAAAQKPDLSPLETTSQRITGAARGRIGVALIHLESGATLDIRGDERFPMASVVKLPIAIEVLKQVAEREADARSRGVARRERYPAVLHARAAPSKRGRLAHGYASCSSWRLSRATTRPPMRC